MTGKLKIPATEFALRYLALGLTALMVLTSLGCASSPSQTARNLSSRESHKLIASKAWSTPAEDQEIAGEDPAKLESHGDRLAASGDWTAALFQYNRALSLKPGQENTRLRLKIAHSHLRGKQWLQAEAAFSMLAKEHPQNPVVWQGLGISLLSRNRIRPAQEALTRTLELRPESWVALQGLGILHNWQGEPGNAIPFFRQAIQVRGDVPSIHNNLGISHMMAGQWTEAVDCFRRALELNPDYKLAANNLGLAYANQGRLDAALNTFERALGPSKAKNNMGVIMAWKGDNQAAAKKFREALRISPRHYQKASHHLSQVSD